MGLQFVAIRDLFLFHDDADRFETKNRFDDVRA
jgi:hypothetical protein